MSVDDRPRTAWIALLDRDGAAAHLSLPWPDPDALPLFDDPAIVHARRAARRLVGPRAVSMLPVDSRHFAGSLWVVDASPWPVGSLTRPPQDAA